MTRRYQIRVILGTYQDGQGRTVQPLGRVLYHAKSQWEAKQIAEQAGPQFHYGAAIVDTKHRTVDWGDQITPLDGEVNECRIEVQP